MKLACLCFFLVALTAATRADFDAPIFENSEEMRNINNGYHRFVDELVWNNAFKWSNGATGTLNTTLLAQIEASLTAFLSAITTTTFRQCDRLSAICYQCENGAANVSRESVAILVLAKLFGQNNNMMDTVSTRTGPQTFTLRQNNNVPLFTATVPCRATPTCFPNTTAQLAKGELQMERMITFKRVAGKMLIDRIATGARYSYIAASETGLGVRIFTANFGMDLVPTDILEDTGLVGIFCFPPSKRRTSGATYYAHRGLPLIDEPY